MYWIFYFANFNKATLVKNGVRLPLFIEDMYHRKDLQLKENVYKVVQPNQQNNNRQKRTPENGTLILINFSQSS